MNLKQGKVEITLSEKVSSVECIINEVILNYFNFESKKTILSIFGNDDNPSTKFSAYQNTEIGIPNEIKYFSQAIISEFDVQSLSHLINFFSLRDLSARYKAEIRNNLKNIQDSAMSGISDIFYYQKKYNILIEIPQVSLCINGSNGNFFFLLKNFHAFDAKKHNCFSTLEIGVDITLTYNESKILPEFNVILRINTLEAQQLKIK